MTLLGYTLEFPPKRPAPSRSADQGNTGGTLADVEPGMRARISSFAPGLSAIRLAHLQAYGVIPGRYVKVIQQFPVTVILVEHCELALENDLAGLIEIQSASA